MQFTITILSLSALLAGVHATNCNIPREIPPQKALEGLFTASMSHPLSEKIAWNSEKVQKIVKEQFESERPTFDYLGGKYIKCLFVKQDDGTYTIMDRDEYDYGNGKGSMKAVIEDLRNGKSIEDLATTALEREEREASISLVKALAKNGLLSEAARYAEKLGVPMPSVLTSHMGADDADDSDDFWLGGSYK